MLAMLRRSHVSSKYEYECGTVTSQAFDWPTALALRVCVCVCGLYLVQSCHEHKYNMWKRASSLSGLGSPVSTSGLLQLWQVHNCHNDCGRQIAWRMSSVPFDSFAIMTMTLVRLGVNSHRNLSITNLKIRMQTEWELFDIQIFNQSFPSNSFDSFAIIEIF